MMKLSPRNQQVCDMTVQGLTNPAIAQALGVSVNTVKAYKARLYRYLGVHSKQELRVKVLGKPVKVEAPTRREVYVSYRKQGLSYKEIGRLEGVSHLHVKSYINAGVNR